MNGGSLRVVWAVSSRSARRQCRARERPARAISRLVAPAFPVFFVMAAPWSGPMDRLVLADPILRPTREPPLLSPQIQQRSGHLREFPGDLFCTTRRRR